MTKEFRIVSRQRLIPSLELRAYEDESSREWTEWSPVKTRSSEGGRYDLKISAERSIKQLIGNSYRFEREYKIQSRPLSTDWEDE
jgi:hypothetical protein